MKKPYDLIYITHARIPTERAHGVQIAHTVESFAKSLPHVAFMLAKQPNPIKEGIGDYYGVDESSFETIKIPSIGIFRRSRIGYWIRSVSFSIVSSLYLLFHMPRILFSREPFPLLFFTLLPVTTVYEMHDFPESHHWFHKFLCRRVDFVIITNAWAYEQCVTRFRIPKAKMLVAPNGYDESIFVRDLDTASIKKEYGIPSDRPVVLYSGNLLEWKGVHILLEASKNFPDALFVIVGGSTESQEALKKKFSGQNIMWVSHVLQREVVRYLHMADILVLPNIPSIQHSEFATSPIKLFEYMAMGKPILASDLPSIRSIVSDNEVTFFVAGDVLDLTEKISHIILHTDEYAKKADHASQFVTAFTWDNRAKQIINFIYSKS